VHPSRNTGFGGVAAGLTVIAGVLVGDVTTTTSNYWCRPPVIAALGIGALVCAFGVWTLGITYWGWWQPQTHEEKMAKLAKREHEALLARFARRDALQELIDELESNSRDLNIQLETGQTFGVTHPGDAWAKNRHVLNTDELAETRDLVRDAYLRTHALNQQTMERFDSASFEQINDANWKKLRTEELTERREALDVVVKARAAVEAAKDET